MSPQPNRGQLFVISAPSGVGKTTLVRATLPQWPQLRYSVSCTTRPPRPGETPGEDYHFLTHEAFRDGIRDGRFIEWAQVHGNYYGTDGERVDSWLEDGHDVLLDIDVQGARQVRCSYPLATTIFILPPALKTLEERLKARGTESDEQLRIRLAAARQEMEAAPLYDFIIVNDLLESAIADLNAVFRACRCRRTVQAPRLKALLFSHTTP